MLLWKLKAFADLTNEEWYQIAKLRNEIFIVEQGCDYQDFDGCDQMSNHLFLVKNGEVVAYLRLIPHGHFYQEASFGRLVVKKEERGHGYAKEMVGKGISILHMDMNETVIKIQAEAYLRDFYRSFGFDEVSDFYLDYGIEHVDMLFEK